MLEEVMHIMTAILDVSLNEHEQGLTHEQLL